MIQNISSNICSTMLQSASSTELGATLQSICVERVAECIGGPIVLSSITAIAIGVPLLSSPSLRQALAKVAHRGVVGSSHAADIGYTACKKRLIQYRAAAEERFPEYSRKTIDLCNRVVLKGQKGYVCCKPHAIRGIEGIKRRVPLYYRASVDLAGAGLGAAVVKSNHLYIMTKAGLRTSMNAVKERARVYYPKAVWCLRLQQGKIGACIERALTIGNPPFRLGCNRETGRFIEQHAQTGAAGARRFARVTARCLRPLLHDALNQIAAFTNSATIAVNRYGTRAELWIQSAAERVLADS